MQPSTFDRSPTKQFTILEPQNPSNGFLNYTKFANLLISRLKNVKCSVRRRFCVVIGGKFKLIFNL